MAHLQEKLFFNLEDVSLELKLGELVLMKYRFVLDIIQMRTGSCVSLCGLGSGQEEPAHKPPERLHLSVENSNIDQFEKAKEMAVELMKSIHLEFDNFRSQKQNQQVAQGGNPATQSLIPAYHQPEIISSNKPFYSLGESSYEKRVSMPSTSGLSVYNSRSQSESPSKRFKTNEDSEAPRCSMRETDTVFSATTSAGSVSHNSLQTNLGLIKVQQCAPDEMSLYAAVADQLFGPLRSPKEQAISATNLHQQAVDYVRMKKEVFFNQVKSLYEKTHAIPNFDPDVDFESGCLYLLDNTKELPWKGHHILLKAIVMLFSKPIIIYEDGKPKDNVVALEVAGTVSYSTSDLSETPLCVWRRKEPKTHYDSLFFVEYQPCIQETMNVESIKNCEDNLASTTATLSENTFELKKQLKFRVGTWHLNKLSQQKDLEAVDRFMRNANLNFVCIQCKMAYGFRMRDTSSYCWRLGLNPTKRYCLLFVFLKKQNYLKCFKIHAPGIFSAEVAFHGDDRTVIVIGCFCASPDALTYFQNLNNVIRSFPSSSQLFVVGEFSHVPFSYFPKSEAHLIGPAFVDLPDTRPTKQAQLLIDLAVNHQLYVVSTWKTTAKNPATFKVHKANKVEFYQDSHILVRLNRSMKCVENSRLWFKQCFNHALTYCCMVLMPFELDKDTS